MRSLGIKAKIWFCIGIFAVGYVALLVLLQWTASETQTHMNLASSSLFPAALSTQEAEAAFQKTNKAYNDAVLLQDKKVLDTAAQDAELVSSALQSAQEKTQSNPEQHAARAAHGFGSAQYGRESNNCGSGSPATDAHPSPIRPEVRSNAFLFLGPYLGPCSGARWQF